MNGRVKTRLRPAGVIFGCLLLITAACGGDETSDGDEEITLTWARPGSHDVVLETFEPVLERFEQENPGVTVEIVEMGFDESFERMPVMAATGELPDVFLPSSHLFYRLAASNALMPLDDSISDELRDDIYDSLWQAPTFDGVTYGIPANIGPIVMWYNADLFEEAGLDPDNPPSDWPALLDAATTIEEETDADGIGLNGFARNDIVDLFGSFTSTSSGEWFWDPDSGNLRDDPALAEALDFLHSLVDEDLTQPSVEQYNRADTRALLRDGEVAITFDGPWVMNVLADVVEVTSPDSPFRTASIPGPTNSTALSIDSWAVAAESDHPEEALALLDFLMLDENQLAHSEGYGVLSPQQSLVEGEELYQAQPWDTFVAAMGDGYPAKPAIAEMSVSDSTIPNAVQRVILGNATGADAIAELAGEIGS